MNDNFYFFTRWLLIWIFRQLPVQFSCIDVFDRWFIKLLFQNSSCHRSCHLSWLFSLSISSCAWFYYCLADGFQWEEGPNSFQPSPTILRFAKDIGVIDQLVLADPTLPRFVFWEDKLYPLPSKLSDPVLNFNLMTWPGKIRAGLGAIGLIAARPKEEESVKEFVTRHLGSLRNISFVIWI